MAYFPNGTAGEILDRQCDECIHGKSDDVMCPVYYVQATFNYKQIDDLWMEKILTHLINSEGICQMKRSLDMSGLLKPAEDGLSELERFDLERGKK